MRAVFVTLSSILLTAAPVLGTPYYIAYEANTPGSFPEDEGWERHITGGGVSRSIEDGIFTLQAINPPPDGGSDQYLFDMQEQLDPDPGEFFFAEWRMLLLPGSDSSDVGVFIATDGMQRAFSSTYAQGSYYSARDNQIAYLDTTIFHTYRMESDDMVDYTMFIDGDVAWQGYFAEPTTQTSYVRFGDGGVFGVSGSQWDYFRFGVRIVPEPGTITLFGICAIAVGASRRQLTKSNLMNNRSQKPCNGLRIFSRSLPSSAQAKRWRSQ